MVLFLYRFHGTLKYLKLENSIKNYNQFQYYSCVCKEKVYKYANNFITWVTWFFAWIKRTWNIVVGFLNGPYLRFEATVHITIILNYWSLRMCECVCKLIYAVLSAYRWLTLPGRLFQKGKGAGLFICKMRCRCVCVRVRNK